MKSGGKGTTMFTLLLDTPEKGENCTLNPVALQSVLFLLFLRVLKGAKSIVSVILGHIPSYIFKLRETSQHRKKNGEKH